jgi:hypothetical protein
LRFHGVVPPVSECNSTFINHLIRIVLHKECQSDHLIAKNFNFINDTKWLNKQIKFGKNKNYGSQRNLLQKMEHCGG